MAFSEHGVVLPPGVDLSAPQPPGQATIVNETGLPDELVQHAVGTYIEENASMLGVSAGNTFQTYANRTGSLLARSNYRAPTTVIGEIELARDLAERDDDIGSAMGSMLATAFGEGMMHVHKDEVVLALFDEVAKHSKLDAKFKEMYREWLIAGSVTTVTAFSRQSFQFQPEGADRNRTRGLVAPLIGVLPAEQIRVVGNDLFGTGTLAYRPATGGQERWLQEFFDEATTPARKAQMRGEDPVLAALLVEKLPEKDNDPGAFSIEDEDPAIGNDLYRLNPRMVARSTMPKGAWRYPRPPLTRNFPLIEAKRLLNLMDYALLQGGSNFLVVAKKGTDQRPALPLEVDNLREVVRRAARTGVIVGDHRLSIEIITPDLSELLSESKRNLIGRKLANGLLRVPEAQENVEATKLRVALIEHVIGSDRRDIRRHVEEHIYGEVVTRNSGLTSAAKLWFPKIMLQDGQWFTDYVLKMRDRGDISRHSAVAAGGFDYDAEVQARKREKPDDRIMTPAPVPHSSPNAGPQDNGPGRPRGASSGNGRNQPASPPARVRPRQVIQRNAGETVTARYEEEVGSYRIGELTYAILEEYADTKTIGRVTPFERAALDAIEGGDYGMRAEGPLTIVPVNGAYELDEVRAVRLANGVSMLVGDRDDGALVARALCFRSPEFDALKAQETAIRWGFGTEALEEHQVVDPEPSDSSREEEHASASGELAPVFHIHVEHQGGKVKRTIVRDKDGNITGSEEEPEPES